MVEKEILELLLVISILIGAGSVLIICFVLGLGDKIDEISKASKRPQGVPTKKSKKINLCGTKPAPKCIMKVGAGIQCKSL